MRRLATAFAFLCLGCAPQGTSGASTPGAPAAGSAGKAAPDNAASSAPGPASATLSKVPPAGAFVALSDDAYGGFKYAPEAPHLGDTAPAIEAVLSTGEAFSLAQALEEQRVLVLFYRGDW